MENAVDNKSSNRFSMNILILSISIIFLLTLSTGYLFFLNMSQENLIDNLTNDINELTESINMQEQQLNMLLKQTEYYRDLANFYSNQSTFRNGTQAQHGYSTIPIVAVHSIQNGFNIDYEAIVMTCEIELVEGSGRILVDTVPMIGIDLQSSVRTATLVVESLTGLSFSNTDIILTIRGTQEIDTVDGGSAGAAITVALLAAVNNQELDSSVYITGTIMSDAKIGEIGGVVYKAIAVAELGGTKFLIPYGQKNIILYQAVTEERFGRTRVTYEKVYVNLEEYLLEKGYNLDIIEVESIQDAYNIFSAF